MGSWILRWNFNKPTYAPAEQAVVSFWLENTGDTYLFLSGLELQFDFGVYDLASISGAVPPRATGFLGSIGFFLPSNVVGRKIFTFEYEISEFIDNNWVDLGFYQSEKQYFISIYPTPFYRAFLSRGLAIEDRAIGDPIAEMIREWGFETITVGVEIQVPEELVAAQVREEVRRADAVIAIATPRFMDALTGLWRTFEWCHSEVGIGFGVDKPLLILRDRRVTLGGLPSYLVAYGQALDMEFNSYNVDELKTGFSVLMPSFREWVETGRKRNFLDSLVRVAAAGVATVGVAVIVTGIIGALAGTSKKK